MVICSLDALKISSKKKETKIKKEIVAVLHNLVTVRSSGPQAFCKKGILRNFTKLTGKRLCQSLFFNKVAGLSPAALLRKDSSTGVFL